MAKKKNKKKPQQQSPISPERYMREKVRSLPIGKCYVTPNWEQSGMAQVIVTRKRPGGNLVFGSFIVDTFCLGVKDAFYDVNVTEERLDDYINRMEETAGIKEADYTEVHNLVYGAIGFAEDAGINSAKEFNIARYVLEEDTDDIPLIEYDYGKNGKHFLVVDADRKELRYLKTLRKNLGDDFDFILPYGDEDENEDEDGPPALSKEEIDRISDGWTRTMEESKRHPKEVYSYEYPEYPDRLSVKNQFIADELFSPDNRNVLPRRTIERILSLDHDEAAEDLSNIVFYAIGKTYKRIADDSVGDNEDGPIMHALLLLTQLGSEKGLDAVLEIIRQTYDFADYHLADLAPEIIHPALYACGMNNVDRIEKYLYERGLCSYLRSQALYALTMIAINHPERRREILDVYRRLLLSLVHRLPVQDACDGEFAGYVMSNLLDLKAEELLPEIKGVYDTDCVDLNSVGDYDSFIRLLKEDPLEYTLGDYAVTDIYEQYDVIRSCYG